MLPYIPSKDELIKIILARYKTIEAKAPSTEAGFLKLRRLEIRRVKETSSYLIKLFRDIAFNMPFLNDLHPFYRELIDLLVDSSKYKHALAKISHVHIAIKSITRDTLFILRTAGSREEILKARKMFLGRLFNLFNDLEPELEYLRNVVKKLKKLPQIRTDLHTFVIAGMPNVGKSSFVRCVSSGKPEIAEYPFTTKEIHVGHIRLFGESTIQVIDTPGLLDRPLSERNKIELQAILALKHLANVIVFLIDPTLHAGYELERQLKLLREIYENFKEIPIVVAINKIDIAKSEEIETAIKCIEEISNFKIYKISTLKCEGTQEMIIDLVNTYIVPKILDEIRKSKSVK